MFVYMQGVQKVLLHEHLIISHFDVWNTLKPKNDYAVKAISWKIIQFIKNFYRPELYALKTCEIC